MNRPPARQRLKPEQCISPYHDLAVSKSLLQNPEMTHECPAASPWGTRGSWLSKDSPWEGEEKTTGSRNEQGVTRLPPATRPSPMCTTHTHTHTLSKSGHSNVHHTNPSFLYSLPRLGPQEPSHCASWGPGYLHKHLKDCLG